ncbi:hypothetical protein BKA62DRAFT_773525 [Auriculariales sp. MPI-PUGE-AT-0066]|nr:hypothetical protein BKA62DRAFT_773525 [Auriculariales sp. MPI-PUGE-AT-0066]
MVIDKAQPLVDAPPPSYESHPGLAAASSSTASSSVKPPLEAPPISRCNFLNIGRPHNKIEGSYVVDPNFQMAEELLAPMTDDERVAGRRANLRLESAHGKVKTDVWVLDSNAMTVDGDDKSPSNWLYFYAPHSSADVRIHDLGNLPCRIEVITTHSTARLQLPRDFVGLLTIQRKHGSVEGLSPDRVTTISEVDGLMKCFVGDISLLNGQPQWKGHKLEIRSTHGSVKLKFGGVDAESETAKKLTKENKGGVKWSWWPALGFVDKDD